jgi:diadenosine tetraphosphate (Ap4A) HIT family hydrolase
MSSSFILDQGLAQDTLLIQETSTSLVLLMNNAYFEWFILVPKTEVTEWYQVSNVDQVAIMAEVNAISRWINDSLNAEKLNVATIGNIVSQLHIHIVGRRSDDPEWPGVVWGTKSQKKYTDAQIENIRHRFAKEVGV